MGMGVHCVHRSQQSFSAYTYRTRKAFDSPHISDNEIFSDDLPNHLTGGNDLSLFFQHFALTTIALLSNFQLSHHRSVVVIGVGVGVDYIIHVYFRLSSVPLFLSPARSLPGPVTIIRLIQ